MQQKTLYLDLNLTRPHFKPLLSPYSRSRTSTDMIAGDFRNDLEFKNRFKTWIGDIWTLKDKRLAEMRRKAGHPSP